MHRPQKSTVGNLAIDQLDPEDVGIDKIPPEFSLLELSREGFLNPSWIRSLFVYCKGVLFSFKKTLGRRCSLETHSSKPV